MVINFQNEENQKAWNAYRTMKEAEGAQSTSLNQYKEAALQLERSCNGKPFSNLTVDCLNDAKEKKPTKHAHMHGFIVDSVNAGFFNVSNDVKIAVIPNNYRQFVADMFRGK